MAFAILYHIAQFFWRSRSKNILFYTYLLIVNNYVTERRKTLFY